MEGHPPGWVAEVPWASPWEGRGLGPPKEGEAPWVAEGVEVGVELG